MSNIPYIFRPIPDEFLTDEFLNDPCMMKLIRYIFKRVSPKKKTVNLRNGKTLELDPYEFMFGRDMCSQETGITFRQVRTRIDQLLRNNHATKSTSKTTSKFSVYKLLTDSFRKNGDQANDQANDQQNDQQNDHKLEAKEVKNIKSKLFMSDSVEIRLSEFFLSLILKKKPNFKKPNLQTWAKAFDDILHKDNRSENDLRHLLLWINQDEFEFPNVMSPGKLRKRLDELEIKSKRHGKPKIISLEDNKLLASQASQALISPHFEIHLNCNAVSFVSKIGQGGIIDEIKYSEHGFKEQLMNKLDKKGFKRI